jgi:hypothetical protein
VTLEQHIQEALEALGRGDVMAVIALLALALVIAVRSVLARTTGPGGSTGIELPGSPTQQQIFDANVQRFAEAIAKAEGFGVPGKIPTVRNNPGNLKIPGRPTGGVNPDITTFATPEEGWEALRKQIRLIASGDSRFYNVNMTLLEMAQIWVGEAGFRNWSRNVSIALGMPESATIAQVLAV